MTMIQVCLHHECERTEVCPITTLLWTLTARKQTPHVWMWEWQEIMLLDKSLSIETM